MLVANLIYHGPDSSQLPSRICLIPYVRQAGHTGIRRANGLGWWRELIINSSWYGKICWVEEGELHCRRLLYSALPCELLIMLSDDDDDGLAATGENGASPLRRPSFLFG